MLSNVGGLSQLTLFNEQWHEKHPNAAKLLWGYESWTETKLYVDAFFPEKVDVTDDPSMAIKTSADGSMDLPNMSPFEKCMICRMFFHCLQDQPLLALLFDRHRTRIRKILKEWAPKWGNIGEDLSCLDVTADYLHKEVPDRNIELGRPKLVFTDGKDLQISTKQNDNVISKGTFSSKTDGDAGRSLTSSTATGMAFQKSYLYGGRGGEKQILRQLSRLGAANADTKSWEDVAINTPWKLEDNTYWTALDNLLKPNELEEIYAKLEDKCPMIVNGVLDDGILLTTKPSGLWKAGINEEDESSDESDDEQPNDDASPQRKYKRPGRSIYELEDAFNDYDNMVKCCAVDKAQCDSGKRKQSPILSVETLNEQNEYSICNDTNRSGRRKLRQLEVLQRLHVVYENGELRKTKLSYFLLVTNDDRMNLLRWMGSDLADSRPKPTHDQLPNVPLCLAKIPHDYGISADKGFVDIQWDLPNLNKEDTPVLIRNSKQQRQSPEQIQHETPITTTHAHSETVFQLVKLEKTLRATVPYWLIIYLQHAWSLARGQANLFPPLRYPGRNAIVGRDYWEGKVNYTRIHQPRQVKMDVEISVQQTCRQCKQGGIVRVCPICKKWYHILGDCHNFDDCTPSTNPYI
ncbi:hypothetical protein ACHAW6_010740 [Cyclotella cf. meneghiniana]